MKEIKVTSLKRKIKVTITVYGKQRSTFYDFACHHTLELSCLDYPFLNRNIFDCIGHPDNYDFKAIKAHKFDKKSVNISDLKQFKISNA